MSLLSPEERKEYKTDIEEWLFKKKRRPRPYDIFDFYSFLTPEERQEFKFEDFIKNPHSFGIEEDLIYFQYYEDYFKIFTRLTLEERNYYKEEIKKFFKYWYWDIKVNSFNSSPLRFYNILTKEEKEDYKDLIIPPFLLSVDIKTQDPHQIFSWRILSLFSWLSPDERKKYQEIIRSSLENIVNNSQKPEKVLFFLSSISPQERQEYLEEIDKIFRFTYRDKTGFLDFLFSLDPEERRYFFERWSTINSYYIGDKIDKYFDEYSGGILDLFSDVISKDENFLDFKRAQDFQKRLENQLISEIGDIGLREFYKSLLFNFLEKGNSFIALDALARKKDKLSLFLGLNYLGLNPLPCLSWRLSKDQELTILSSIARLIETGVQEKIFQGIYLPFRPRGRKVSGFEKGLTEWFQQLAFLQSLNISFETNDLLLEHLESIKKIQQESNISLTTDRVPFSVLKKIVKELKEVNFRVKKRFQELLNLGEIPFEKFQKFVEKWKGEIQSIIILASRFLEHGFSSKSLELLRKIVLGELEDNYFRERYNIDEPLIRKQLAPLLEQVSPEQRSQIIMDYHKGVSFLVLQKEKDELRVNLERFSLSEQEIKNLFETLHFDQLLTLSFLSHLSKEEKKKIIEFIRSPFLSQEQQKEISPKNLKEFIQYLKEKNIGENYIKIFVSLYQFFKDLIQGNKTPLRFLEDLDKLKKNIENTDDQMASLSLFKDDIDKHLRRIIETKSKEKEKKPGKQKFYLCHTTDHPKTLLEIGKYPLDSGSCQNYEYSDINLAGSVLGYVFDSHIQAVVIREMEIEMDPKEYILEIVHIDEGRNILILKTDKGKEKEVYLSKPIARAIFFLGRKDNQPVFVLQRNYSQPGIIDLELAEKLEEKTLEELIKKLNSKYNLNLRKMEKGEEGIFIAGSHNPLGHYNDIMKGQVGQNGKGYYIGSKNERRKE